MSPCLAPDEFVDLVDGTLPPARQAHLAACAACAAMARDVADALTLAASADVPEPSPLFWASLNARVQADMAAISTGGWRAWLRWDVMVPLAGLAALVVALASAVDRSVAGGAGGGTVATTAAADAVDVAPGDDDALAMMIDLAESLPDGGFDALGVTALPEMGEAATALSADEQRALAALLTSAVDRPRS